MNHSLNVGAAAGVVVVVAEKPVDPNRGFAADERPKRLVPVVAAVCWPNAEVPVAPPNKDVPPVFAAVVPNKLGVVVVVPNKFVPVLGVPNDVDRC